jgi:hypothetical protein
MKRNRIIFFIFLLFMAIKCYGQSGLSMSVYGKAIDWNSNIPIKDFEVTLFMIEDGVTKDIRSAKTNEEGFYKIRYLVKGNYEFLIELPGIGIIYALDFESGLNDNFYGFEIREGQNLNLNFTIGSAEFGEIKKEVIAPDIIDITILYPDEWLNETVPEERTAMQITSTCRVIIGTVSETTVGDNVKIGTARNGQPAGGRFHPLLRWSNVRIDCENDKCVLKSINVTISGTIELHSEDWFFKKYGTDCKESVGSCLKDCIRKHEQRHWDDAVGYYKDSFCDTVNSLNNVSAKCSCYLSDPQYYDFKCKEELRDILQKYRDKFNNYMKTTSEDNAYGVSDPCCSTCRIIHREGGQQ